MLVYLVRHGESVTNVSRIWTGWGDVKLTEKGKKDAKLAKAYLKNISFDKVFSSDLARAMQTAKIVLPGYAIEKKKDLREINVGWLSGRPYDCLSTEERSQTAQIGFAQYGGESREEMNRRISDFMKELESLDCEKVAMFSHAGWLRGMLDIVTGIKQPRNKIQCNNCAISIYEYEKGTWKLLSWINPM